MAKKPTSKKSTKTAANGPNAGGFFALSRPLPNDPIGVRPFPACSWCRFRPMRASIMGPAHPDRLIRRRQQQLEECPGSFVFGSGSAAIRTLHDDGPFGRANAPPPYSAALLQHQFKNGELIDVAIQGNFHLIGA